MVGAACWNWLRPSLKREGSRELRPNMGTMVQGEGEGVESQIANPLGRPSFTLTFNRDIAPIIFENCSGCHRPNRAAPFSLVDYAQVRKRATQIAEVTASRFMPPWLPMAGHGEFVDARILTEKQIEMIQRWAVEGRAEGDSKDLPPKPVWSDAWESGEPDLVVSMPQAYPLRSDGPDIYRNFVIPTQESFPRFVRGVEIRPGNPKVVHHAVLQVDRTRGSRNLDESDPVPGFGGIMSVSQARIPDGHFIGWTPGKTSFQGQPDLAWRLEPGSDLVLQLHMRSSGKPEAVRATIGLYFTESPPVAQPYALILRSKSIDIPAGESAYLVESNYALPVDVRVLSIYPHAHYLGKEMEASVSLPDGNENRLFRILDWDFNWQDEYRYVEPVYLPRGTVVSMRYTFDNSASNVRNPNHPPKRVAYGQNSTDEMAELMLQVLPKTARDLEVLRNDAAQRAVLDQIDLVEKQLRTAPMDLNGRIEVGLLYQRIRNHDQALAHFARAVEIAPGSARSHYLLADTLAEAGRFDEAQVHFEEADRLAPNQPETINSLAQVLARNPNVGSRDPERAIGLALQAADLTRFQNPAILETAAVAYASAGNASKAIEYSEQAIQTAIKKHDSKLATQIERRLEAYRVRMGRENGSTASREASP